MKKKRKERNFSATVFRMVATVLFFLLITFFALHLGLSNAGLKKLVNSYVNSTKIDTQYFDNFLDAGFSEEECYEFLGGEEIKGLVSDVMCERIYALFKDSSSYKITSEYCEDKVRSMLKNTGKSLSDKKLDVLTKYTLDISGITAMFIYDSPAAYRYSIYNDDSTKIGEYDSVFSVISTLSSPVFVFTLILMYAISLVLMFAVGTLNTDTLLLGCNTITYPSFLFIGISAGYLLGEGRANVTTAYVFTCLLIASAVCFIAGCLLFTLIYFTGKKREPNKGWSFTKWLEKRKENYKNNGGKQRKKNG